MDSKEKIIKDLSARYLDEEAVGIFDKIIAQDRARRARRAVLAVAASLAAGFLLIRSVLVYNDLGAIQDFTTVEILQTINNLTEIDPDNIKSITAKPEKHRIVLTAEFADGTEGQYFMKRGEDGSSIEITAENIKQ